MYCRSLTIINNELQTVSAEVPLDLISMYHLLYELSYATLTAYSMSYIPRERDEVSHQMATTLLLKMRDKGLKVTNWCKFVRLCIRSQIRDYYLKHSKIPIEIEDPIDKFRIQNNFKLPMRSTQEVFEIELFLYISSIAQTLRNSYNQYSRYRKYSLAHEDCYLGVLLTAIHAQPCTELPFVDSGYLKLVSRRVLADLRTEICELISQIDASMEDAFVDYSTILGSSDESEY